MKRPLIPFPALVAAVTLAITGTRSHGAEFTVASAADSGAGTLRQALIDAAANAEADTIRFAPALAGGTIALSSNSTYANLLTKFGPTCLVIDGHAVTIDGSDAPFLAISGANARRIFAVTTTGSLTLQNITLTGGLAKGGKGGNGYQSGHGGGGGAGLGGAVWVEGSLSVNGCTFHGNAALGGNGGAPGGVAGNTGVGGGGGGLGVDGKNGSAGGSGAAPGTSGTGDSGNAATGGFGGGGGGGVFYEGVGGHGGFGGGGGGAYGTTVWGGAFGGQGAGELNNSKGGGAGAGLGGAIFIRNGVCNLTNSTFTNNSATSGTNYNETLGGGVQGSGGAVFNYQGDLSILSCTLHGNDAVSRFVSSFYTSQQVANAHVYTETSGKGSVSISNSVLTGSAAGKSDFGKSAASASVTPKPISGGGNLMGSSYNSQWYGSGSVSGWNLDPKLAAMADNGGPTLTMLPGPTSGVIDRGDPVAAAALTVDQRGNARFAGSKLDVGAVQITLGPPALTASAAQVSGLSASFSANISLAGASAVTERGFVWAKAATNSDPLIGGAGVTRIIDANTGIGSFSAQLATLSSNTAYVFKAYATNSIGTAYASAVNFTTNQAPVVTSDGGADTATITIAENSTAVTTVRASDADNPAQQISYTISGGADAAKFAIDSSSGALSFVNAPDYDIAGDADANGVYEVTVQAADNGNTPRTDSQQVSVSLSDVAEAPLLSTPTGVEITPVRATVGGTVVHDGGAGDAGAILERGVVYSLTDVNADPWIGGIGVSKTVTPGTTGVFSLAAIELSPGTSYSYRPYAINAQGVSYGPSATFTTAAGPALTGDLWTHYAGSATGVSGTTNGTASAAKFNAPKGITVDNNGDPFVADTLNHTIRKIVGATAAVTTDIGTAGTAGSSDSGFLVWPKFNTPGAITAFGAAGSAIKYYIADTANHTVRLGGWTLLGGWNASTVGGTAGSTGFIDATGAAARFRSPEGIAADGTGNVYVADTGNHAIRKLDVNKVVTTQVSGNARLLAWGGSSPAWGSPAAGGRPVVENAFAADISGTHLIVALADGTVDTWGGVIEAQEIPAGLTGVSRVAAGKNLSVALKTDGSVVAWGRNGSGQASVPTGLTGVTAIDAGDENVIARKSDGSVVVWGDNTFGQNTVPSAATGVTAVAMGAYHALALKSDGTVVAWGNNYYGQTAVPAGLTGVTAIAAGTTHSLALKSDGTVVAWGSNNRSQCVVPEGLSGVVSIAAGNEFSLALKSDGTIAGWGSNIRNATSVPSDVLASGPTSLMAGGDQALALTTPLSSPKGVAADAQGNLFIADTGNHVIRKYTAATGVVSVFAGSVGQSGSADGLGPAARFSGPRGITVDSDGNVYVTDETDHTVRWITRDGMVRTLGGLAGTSGLANGAPEVARFKNPAGIASGGGLVFVADTANHRIVKGTPLFRPIIGVAGASDVTLASVTLKGWVNPNGKATTALFQYGLTTGYGSTAAATLASSSSTSGQAVSAAISGLQAGTLYHYRLTASNADGSTTTVDGTFSTGNVPGLAAMPSSTGIGTATATLGGEVTSDGNLTLTDIGIVFAPSASNASPVIGGPDVVRVGPTGATFATGSFEVPVTGLAAGTSYSFRAYATNAAGTSYSDVGTFTTESFERVVFDNTAGKTRAFEGRGNGLSPNLAFGYNFTTGDQGFDLTSITLGLSDFDPATAIRIRLFESGEDSLPSGPAVATQDYPSQSFGWSTAYHTFSLSGFRLKADTTYILFVGASSGNANWGRYEPNVNPASNAGWTVNTMLVESAGDFYNMAGNPDRWSIQLTGTPYTPTAPVLGSASVSDITSSTVSFDAAVSDDGGAEITGFGFVYAPTSVQNLPEIDGPGVTRVTGTGASTAFTANATGLAASTGYSVRAYAASSAGTSYSEVVTFTTTDDVQISPSGAWRQRYFGIAENAGNAADLATPDGDGIANLVKYALGLTPGQNGASSLPKAKIATHSGSRYLSLGFRRDPSRDDVTILVEVQGSIGGAWTEIARSVNGGAFSGAAGVTETENPDGTKEVEIRDTQTVGSASRRFMRVRVER